MEGWIKLHRKLSNNPLWTSEPFTRGQAWVDLLLLANHEPGYIYVRDHKIELKRGQVGWSQNGLSERWKWSRTKVRNFLNDLEKEQQIKQIKSKSYTVITLINYELYQKKETQKTTGEQQEDTNNNDKNEENEEYSPLISDLPAVKKMEEPLTPEQADKLIKIFGRKNVERVLLSMENWKPLTKKNKSAYLTANTWLQKDQKTGSDNDPTPEELERRYRSQPL